MRAAVVMKPPDQSLPENPGTSKDDQENGDARSPLERTHVPSTIQEPTIRNDSSDIYARRLDNAINRPGQATPEENWASLEASYDPEYYAPVEREAREKRQALEQKLAAKGIVLPKGVAASNEDLPAEPHGDSSERAEPETFSPPTGEIRVRSPVGIIYKAAFVGVLIAAALIGVYLFGMSEGERRASSHKDAPPVGTPLPPPTVAPHPTAPRLEQPTASANTAPPSEASPDANQAPAPVVPVTRQRAPTRLPESASSQVADPVGTTSTKHEPPLVGTGEPKKSEASPPPPAPDVFR